MQISPAGLAVLRDFEKLRLASYADPGGVWTIGWGHTGDEVCAGMACTDSDAERWLRADLAGTEKAVTSAIARILPACQFDALVIFTFNVGVGAFLHSALCRSVASGDPPAVSAPLFLHFVTAGGKHSPGLVRRREAEITLFTG
jgi:lysozyme